MAGRSCEEGGARVWEQHSDAGRRTPCLAHPMDAGGAVIR
jgi:hypothetical protein